ncbi:beta-lactamase domain-containing protein [Novosphingobium nitrogenifigens DSM 19370]|uniref:Beta-lactamase domain-containing protein n=1 Tax=Novosphingobium nitrogenifigens DSM 19370 TaxID=983920 RepID=F1ZB96_9SPHN|nr:quinoprotein relay system zinc metallohydrolase 1 [Novosphingobium nitrogenifigens]EGD58206.1 beta-lactamase domain-containing protein [Novosphingobium nitrogenifigens DSM 19370]
MTALTRRGALGMLAGGLVSLTGAAQAEQFAGTYHLVPVALAEGIWLVRGADAPIAFANGGAIANCVIMASNAGPILFDCGPSRNYATALSALARKLTGKPPALVLISHLHPDHSLGASAFDPAIVAALPGTIADIERDGPGMSDAMFRMLADWMRGTEVVVPGRRLAAGPFEFGGRHLQLFSLAGHSASDLVALDEASGTLLAGDLVFKDRAPATPHATLSTWLASLDRLAAIPHRRLVPGHGPWDQDGSGIAQTRDWLTWLDKALHDASAQGLDMTEAGEIAIPARFAGMQAARYELQRSVSHFYPAIEIDSLPRIDGGTGG